MPIYRHQNLEDTKCSPAGQIHTFNHREGVSSGLYLPLPSMVS